MKNDKTNKKLIYGVGINDLNEPAYINRKSLKFYSTWKGMIERCYSEKFHIKNPTYRGCTVCSEWLVLSNFREWFDANYREGMALDKDILIKGNRVYCPEACSFIPRYINNLLTDASAIRGDCPLGVVARRPGPKTSRVNTTYEALCSDGHGVELRKTFRTAEEARQWYSMKKKEVVKDIVLESFWRNEIMSDVATALLEREW